MKSVLVKRKLGWQAHASRAHFPNVRRYPISQRLCQLLVTDSSGKDHYGLLRGRGCFRLLVVGLVLMVLAGNIIGEMVLRFMLYNVGDRVKTFERSIRLSSSNGAVDKFSERRRRANRTGGDIGPVDHLRRVIFVDRRECASLVR